MSSPGGWYDAGDYNKYIINSSITVWELLHVIEMYPDYVDKLKLNIPESGNDLPDMLDEILVNLKWMLTMQDPDDGGVYAKLTSLNFCGFIMPQDDNSERYVVQKTTAAALDFVATMCKAERVLRRYPQYEDFCDHIQGCYMRAYNWAMKNQGILYRQPK
ncbi:MAG: glycoside hydrolase family 9 protein, partial [Bacteroidales bacterium]|nr:glycoside hydrolase family 9 protein [Bacteroidales bacterium]